MNSKKPYIIEGQRVSHDEYTKNKYEDLRIRVPKGKKEAISEYAKSQGKSVNSFVNEAIDKSMNNNKDNGE